MEKVNGEVNGLLQFPNTKSNLFSQHKDSVEELSNSLHEISYFPTVNTNNPCFSMREDQQAPVVIQDANDLLYNEPSHI